MKNTSVIMSKITVTLVFFLGACMFSCGQQQTEPWSEKQLMEPKALADIINRGETGYYVYAIGPGALLKNSIEIGECRHKEHLDKLKAEVSKLPKDAKIVLYCGCCPFKNCPNVRPAFQLLNDMKFTNHKLLNLSQNFKVDWLDKGYPINE
ncbi:MAG: rhodanese-like domain-containing protein [Flavobacteriales bacterium]|nr:rhodanese-like domain-containing protein [Flavobacteriales bacterium]MCZ2443825.1 rhodanese-like domain-containing protein [Flavobacteriales bacterium]